MHARRAFVAGEAFAVAGTLLIAVLGVYTLLEAAADRKRVQPEDVPSASSFPIPGAPFGAKAEIMSLPNGQRVLVLLSTPLAGDPSIAVTYLPPVHTPEKP